ncbi:adenylate isopentenyltransferase 5, chloroplastic-like [Impatiens glandulifera]|uniref:adenylate isopentenyltransferase 5, chloroplastic-like n=1 Tax=Impatiens glandulifera TaxID=253017 RepID=UPI001FB0C657|nr:adenylate isopentenyltransferase 5, chloroplastic-like [Impatiens glandulifera]
MIDANDVEPPKKKEVLPLLEVMACVVASLRRCCRHSRGAPLPSMRISFSAVKLPQPPPPLLTFPAGITMDPFINPPWWRKEKVIVVMGSTGTGKSKLSIDIARRFPAEVVNSDKIQIFRGLEIVTNKVTEDECCGVPHHLMGIADSDEDFTSDDFCRHANDALSSIVKRGRVPIIAGGSNSYIKALANDDYEFRSKYECCFLWADVSSKVLNSFLSERVDRMVEIGLVDEVRGIFNPTADYSRGIRQAIGVPEMDDFFRIEWDPKVSCEVKVKILRKAIEKIKTNTCKLAKRQHMNIIRLQTQLEWTVHRLDATEAFQKRGNPDGFQEAWKRLVTEPSIEIVRDFLRDDGHVLIPPINTNPRMPFATNAVATVTR